MRIFPIEFMKKEPTMSFDLDFVTPTVNFVGNTFVVGAGLYGIATIAKVAARALGTRPEVAAFASQAYDTLFVASVGAAVFGAAVGVIATVAFFYIFSEGMKR